MKMKIRDKTVRITMQLHSYIDLLCILHNMEVKNYEMLILIIILKLSCAINISNKLMHPYFQVQTIH